MDRFLAEKSFATSFLFGMTFNTYICTRKLCKYDVMRRNYRSLLFLIVEWFGANYIN